MARSPHNHAAPLQVSLTAVKTRPEFRAYDALPPRLRLLCDYAPVSLCAVRMRELLDAGLTADAIERKFWDEFVPLFPDWTPVPRDPLRRYE